MARIVGVDIPNEKVVRVSLTYIYGIGPSHARDILEAAKVAPTARNLQPQKILVLTAKEELDKLSLCTKYGWNAPVMMIIFYDKDISYKRESYDNKDFGIIDASIVTTHMMLEIQNLGLGTTWIGAFNPEKIREVYNIPENFEIVSILPIGYPAEDSKPSDLHFKRNELEQFVYWNKLNVTNKNNA